MCGLLFDNQLKVPWPVGVKQQDWYYCACANVQVQCKQMQKVLASAQLQANLAEVALLV